MSKIKEKHKLLEEYLIATRRHFHENPESSLKEYDTAAYIQKELTLLAFHLKK